MSIISPPPSSPPSSPLPQDSPKFKEHYPRFFVEHVSQYNYIKLFDKSCATLDNTALDLKELGAQVALFCGRLYTESLYPNIQLHMRGLPQLGAVKTGAVPEDR